MRITNVVEKVSGQKKLTSTDIRTVALKERDNSISFGYFIRRTLLKN